MPTFAAQIMDWTPHILYEDNHYIVISKPAGLAVQAEADGEDAVIPRMQALIGQRDKKPGKAFIGVMHRLDKPVKGVLVLAKTSKGQERFNELLKQKSVTKYYLVITERNKMPQEGTLRHFFSRKDEDYKMTVKAQQHNASDQEAILKYKILSIIDDYQLWAIELITGRRHQIRAQLAHMGNPILGDRRYGSKVPDDTIALHCAYMSFEHPIKHETIQVKDMPSSTSGRWKDFKPSIMDWMNSIRATVRK